MLVSVLFSASGTLLTMTLLMRALDPLQYEQETEEYLEKLAEVDSYRKGYYKDLGESESESEANICSFR